MNRTTHTPGPWKVVDCSPLQIWSDGSRICKAFKHQGHNSEERYEANARLIAAAPDLLEALQEVMDFADGYVGLYSWQDKARAAIAKAAGAAL